MNRICDENMLPQGRSVLGRKIIIISDSHDNLPNIDEALRIIKREKIETMIHCGDLTSVRTLNYLRRNFFGKIYLALGNADYNLEEKEEDNLKIFSDFGEICLGDKKIGFCHEPAKAKKFLAEGGFDLIFYGHTHRPWEENIGRTRFINPGNVAGLIHKASFAIYDTIKDELKLKILYK